MAENAWTKALEHALLVTHFINGGLFPVGHFLPDLVENLSRDSRFLENSLGIKIIRVSWIFGVNFVEICTRFHQ